jgi:hypothetical protein
VGICAGGAPGPVGICAGGGDWKFGTLPLGSIVGMAAAGPGIIAAWGAPAGPPEPQEPSPQQANGGGGIHGGEHGIWLPNWTGQQPSAQIDPNTPGLKALYGLQQIVVQFLQQR